MSEFLGVAGLAAAVSTALATGVSTAVALWWRGVDRRSPEWAFFGARAQWWAPDVYGNAELPHVRCSLANTGPGTAFRFRVVGIGCHVLSRDAAHFFDMTHRGWGNSDDVLVPGFPAERLAELLVYCEPSQWAEAAVAITWREQSPWRRQRRQRVHLTELAEIAARPTYERSGNDDLTSAVTTTPPQEPAGPALPTTLHPQRPPLPSARGERRRQLRDLRRR